MGLLHFLQGQALRVGLLRLLSLASLLSLSLSSASLSLSALSSSALLLSVSASLLASLSFSSALNPMNEKSLYGRGALCKARGLDCREENHELACRDVR